MHTLTLIHQLSTPPNFCLGLLLAGFLCLPVGATPALQVTRRLCNTGILDKLSVGDNVMADKGFLIHDLLPEGDYQWFVFNLKHS